MGSLIKPVVLAVMLLACAVAGAQPQVYTVTYDYDANGNRDSCKSILMSKSAPSPKVEEEIKNEEQTILVAIYPNPTKGDLIVELSGVTPDQLVRPSNVIQVWNVRGQLILKNDQLDLLNHVDLSTQADGIYIMELVVDGKSKKYKILKE